MLGAGTSTRELSISNFLLSTSSRFFAVPSHGGRAINSFFVFTVATIDHWVVSLETMFPILYRSSDRASISGSTLKKTTMQGGVISMMTLVLYFVLQKLPDFKSSMQAYEIESFCMYERKITHWGNKWNSEASNFLNVH